MTDSESKVGTKYVRPSVCKFEHIPSKLVGKWAGRPKNMTWIIIRFVLTVALVDGSTVTRPA